MPSAPRPEYQHRRPPRGSTRHSPPAGRRPCCQQPDLRAAPLHICEPPSPAPPRPRSRPSPRAARRNGPPPIRLNIADRGAAEIATRSGAIAARRSFARRAPPHRRAPERKRHPAQAQIASSAAAMFPTLAVPASRRPAVRHDPSPRRSVVEPLGHNSPASGPSGAANRSINPPVPGRGKHHRTGCGRPDQPSGRAPGSPRQNRRRCPAAESRYARPRISTHRARGVRETP